MTECPTFINHADGPPACRGHDPELWFPTTHDRASSREAKAICHTCTYETACREWAYTQPPTMLHGIWGGTTASERYTKTRRR